MFVTAQTPEAAELRREFADALGEIGVQTQMRDETLLVDDTRIGLDFVVRAHPTPAGLAELVQEARRPGLLIADRISEPGRQVLRGAGWGWLDRRGHVRVWVPGVRIEAPVPGRDGQASPGSGNPWTTVGLEVALAALVHPDDPVTARHVAPVIGRSVGAAHEMVTRFAAVGLVGPSTRLPLLPDLFWETASHWPDDDWLALAAEIPDVTAKLGPEVVLRVDERAATLGGARIPAIGDLPARLYLRTGSALRRARAMVDNGAPTRCWVRRAPVHWLPENPDHPPTEAHPWPVAHPIVCALRLGADPARGREIVEDWGIVPGTEQ